MYSQELLNQMSVLSLEVQRSQSTDNEELRLLLEASLLAIQEAVEGLKQNNNAIYRPWFLKCNEYIDYVNLHRALNNEF